MTGNEEGGDTGAGTDEVDEDGKQSGVKHKKIDGSGQNCTPSKGGNFSSAFDKFKKSPNKKTPIQMSELTSKVINESRLSYQSKHG